ncbi:polyA polymerase family protein [Deferribacter desulfuricans SSM1]|uniref:PolyA polymerase family protein n=1 Tax=Deferribacter desulfuricans (strain DSM 14783 / JCM 11476 / NBRC 101012 / SSM1) TaxID=639282 RepID=D3PD73_DEFDS|nr:CBS domain-containing protein [Deferribacter desulfuricans]BAI80546.1 polyA polymerase family protein [Deferribacter desulfuricans SSM1]
MKIVLTHISPDFDAFASAYTALKLYDADYFVYTTGFDDAIKKFIRDYQLDIPLIHLNELDTSNIETIIITDCKIRERLGDAANLLSKAKKIIIYDHHPVSGRDIDADEEFIFNFGSTSTIITERIKIRGLKLDIATATLLLLGIYEDTGFLSFSNTTPRDLYASAFLLENGADISVLQIYLQRDLSKQHIFILNQLLQNLNVLRVASFSIGIAHASYDEYVPEVAVLANKILNLEGLDACLLLIRIEDRVLFVGRSKVDEIDVSKVAEGFKGGGHPYAASAVIKDMTLQESLEKLSYLIEENIKPIKFAMDFMTSPVKYIDVDSKFEEALDIFMKYNLNGMPVVKDGKTVGLISRKDILQGMKHGLKNEKVSSIMQTEFFTVKPDTPFSVVEDIILEKRQKLVPVEEDGRLVGVITRTDFLRAMAELNKTPKYILGRISSIDSKRFRNVKHLMKDRLPGKIYNILVEIGVLADQVGMNAYVVGGFVRDLIMKIENFDIDIVVEGDAVVLAKKFAKLKNAKVSVHYKFKTAVVILPDNFRIDFATARSEYYDFPAAAPKVEDSSIKIDLYRRDFTINTIAIKLNKEDFGALVDYFGAQSDIRDRKIRVLHNLSFVDDPSRIFRAIRFAVRYNFDIGPHTERLLKHAINLKLIDRIVGQRLFLEIKYILCEKEYLKALNMMKNYGILKFFSNSINFSEESLEIFKFLDKLINWYSVQINRNIEIWIPRFNLLFHSLKRGEFIKLLERFEFNSNYKKYFASQVFKSRNAAIRLKKNKNITNSYIYNTLKDLEDEFVLYLSAILGEKFENLIKKYYTYIKEIKLEINGNDLKDLGYKPSEKFKYVLDKLLELKLDGVILNKGDEIKYAKKLFEEIESGRNSGN